jgi:predicted secreted protein
MAAGTTGYMGRRHFRIALPALFLLSVLSTAASATTTLSAADDGKEVTVLVNSTFSIELDEQGSTGYGWDFDDLDRTMVNVVEVATRTKSEAALVGAPVVKTWTLRATKTGATDIKLLYFRAWEGKGTAVKSFSIHLRIVDR